MREYWLKCETSFFWDCDENSFLKHVVLQHRNDRNMSQKCTTSPIRRRKHNCEVVDRNWLCFSPSQTCVKCLTCRLMYEDTTKCAHFLTSKGIFDWQHGFDRLRSREQSVEHKDFTITFSRRCNEEQIQSWTVRSINANDIGNRHCLQRLVSVVRFISERGREFRNDENVGSPTTFFQNNFNPFSRKC